MARPTKYKEEHCEAAKKLCLLGATDVELADFFGVTEKTLNNWKKTKPGFFQSIKEGKIQADALVADRLFNRACGYSHEDTKIMQHEGAPVIVPYTKHYPPDAVSAIFWLTNRQSSRWRRAPDPSQGDTAPPPAKIVFEVADARRS